MLRALLIACLLATPVLGHGDWSPPCEQEWMYRWYRPDQKRDSLRDEPEQAPRLPHARSVGAGRQRGYPPPCNEDVRKQRLSQWLSPADDPVGYRGVCELHHSGPPCRGDPRPLPPWVTDSPDECCWDHEIRTLREVQDMRNAR